MNQQNAVYAVALGIAGVLPLVLVAVVFLRRARWGPMAVGRYRAWLAGIVVAGVAGMALPVFLASIQAVPEEHKTAAFQTAMGNTLVVGLLGSLAAMVLVCFGRGLGRLLGLAAAAVSFCSLYVMLMGLSA